MQEFKEKPLYDLITRLWQVPVSILALIVLSPLLLIISILIKLSSKGPILYKHQRVGKDEKRFWLYKFRTLKNGSDVKLGDATPNHKNVLSYSTPIGRFLRKTKLDELPQLLNVIKGDMNLVGPRPVRPIFLERYKREMPLYTERFRVKPGLTGKAQLRGGYNTREKDKLRYELLYIKRRGLGLDLSIILLTLVKLFKHWLAISYFFIFLFLFISFIPLPSLPWLYFELFGLRFTLLHLFIVVGIIWILVKKEIPNKIHLYHTAINRPIVLFILVGLFSVLFSSQPLVSLRGLLYYLITGFLISFMIINTRISRKLAIRITRIIAFTGIIIVLLGIIDATFLKTQMVQATTYSDLLSLSNGEVSSTYLVLVTPFILYQILHVRSIVEKKFWYISFVVVFLTIFLTGGKLGILALLVSSITFIIVVKRRSLLYLLLAMTVVSLIILSIKGERSSSYYIQSEKPASVFQTIESFFKLPIHRLAIGGGKDLPPTLEASRNMHFTLILENGIIGWSIMMWIILTALREIWGVYYRVKAMNKKLKDVLWAIFSSIIGFLICMNSFPAFRYLIIQFLFWVLIGLSIGITTHFGSWYRTPRIKWRFGH